METNEEQRLTDLDNAVFDIGQYLMLGNCYLKVYFEQSYGLQVEVYLTNEPGHMRDTELNRIHAIQDNHCYLHDVIMALHKAIDSIEEKTEEKPA